MGKPEKFYRAKYKGTVWQLVILAELDAKGEDEPIKNACEFFLANSQDKKSGGFSIGDMDLDLHNSILDQFKSAQMHVHMS